jgi:hypothetical protein
MCVACGGLQGRGVSCVRDVDRGLSTLSYVVWGVKLHILPRPDIDPNFLLLNLPCFLTAPEVFSWLYDEYKVISGYLVGMDELCL